MTSLPRLRSRKARRKSLLAATTLVALLGLFGGVAEAANEIEGVWSFGGGSVAIQGQAGGGYQGTVVEGTVFAVCEHPVGQVMWTGMRERPDGSFWGRHLWYHGAGCDVDPNPGLTAYRVVPTAAGQRILLVCFSNPGDPSQPLIAPDGEVSGDTYGCVESEPLARVPGSSGARIDFDQLLTLPPPKAPGCRRTLTLVPRNLRYDPLKRIEVRIAGIRVATVTASKDLHRKIVLRQLPEGRFRFQVVVVTVLKQRFARTRVYRGCSQKVSVRGPRGPGQA
jgi:hypothetical protein